MVSREFKVAVKMADRPAWRIAAEAGIPAAYLSRWMSGALIARPGDHRVIKVGRILGLTPSECFEEGVPC